MTPVIVLVGRPNVGKSTLFNRLTKSKDALVSNFPGLTRDRQYGLASFDEKTFILIDTGGIGVEDQAVDTLMVSQSQKAIQEATHVFFMVDARAGLTPSDRAIATELRKQGREVTLVINKTDGLDEKMSFAEFAELGFAHMFTVSAAHGRGVGHLLQAVTEDFTEEAEAPDEKKGIVTAVIGRPNVGKSTLINRVLGDERMVVYDMPGTTRDSIYVPFERDGQDYTLIDTAGVRRRSKVNEKIEKFSIIKTLNAIKDANVCLILIDANEGVTDQDMHLIGFAIEAGKGIVVAVNKWDGLDEDHRIFVKDTIMRKLHFASFAKFHFISALHGSGVGNLFKDIQEAYASAIKSFQTNLLTRYLQDMVAKHPPPLVKGRRVKLRYAHAGGHNPPIIVIHGTQVDALPESYKRYINNAFLDALQLVGTPLKVVFKSGENPFEGKKNKLTERQVKRKKRLMRFVKKRK